ncbi:Kunitz-type serine protease inhibitor 6 [Anabarilius grahami]|uniref:Kunitz-type serine protease inhibitor 6 n=1 Tax=Anabarilius grahami TaxID=495550 RepID=A0A3N0Y061_ANAGA|nr:Kunitz-type serine protease inhibitor 6 [Anabarilius grahami]
MAQVRFIASIVGFLCCLSVLNACKWDPETDVEQGLSNSSYDDGAAFVAYLSDISDEECQKACCEIDDCHIALIGTPADDGRPECRLVNCLKDGKDVCVLTQSSQFKVYRKILETAEQEPQNEAEVRSANTDHCRLPRVVGNCRAAFPRFYYDVTNQTCKPFIYGGCGGNDNNFNTTEECEASCSGVTGAVLTDSHSVSQRSRMSVPENNNDDEPKALPEMTSEEFQEKCLADAQTGRCRASIRRYYYNNGTCQPFIYGGCSGNQNNYETEETCMTNCTVRLIPSNQKAPVVPSTPSFEETCAVPSDSGPCRALFHMYYFEASSQSCKQFIYGGCQGNLNRYGTEEECMSACYGKDERFDAHGHHKHGRWTPAFFLVATLAIMSALLLVGLILIAVRRNSNRRFFVLDDKEELLPAEEQVSYEKQPKVDSN